MRMQDVPLAGELRRGAADAVPVLGVAGSGAQGALLTAAADADRRMRSLRPLRLVNGVGELEVATLERERRLGQQADEHLAGLLDPVAALARGAHFDAVRPGSPLVPPGADPPLEPARRDGIQGG